MTYRAQSLRRLQRAVLIPAAVSFFFIFLMAFRTVSAGASEAKELDFAVSVTGENADTVNKILDNPFLSVKGLQQGDALLLNMDIYAAGEDMLRLLLKATPERLAFSAPELANTTYEYDMKGLSGLLQGTFGLSPDMLTGSGAASLLTALPDNVVEEAAAVLQPYAEYLISKITEGMQEEAGTVLLSRLGITAEGSTLTWEPDAGELAGICEDLAGMIEKDEAAGKFVEKIAGSVADPAGIGALISQAAGSMGEYTDLQEISTSLTDAFASMPSLLREMAGQLSGSGMEGGYLRISESRISSVSCRYILQAGSAEEQLFCCGIEMDPERPGQSGCLFFEMPEQDYCLTYNSEETEDDLVRSSVMLKMFSVPVATLTIVSDPSAQSGGMSVREAGLDIMGIYAAVRFPDAEDMEAGEPVQISIRGIGVPGDPVGITGADITAVAKAADANEIEAPSGPILDISGFSSSELGSLFNHLAEAAMQRAEGVLVPVLQDEAW